MRDMTEAQAQAHNARIRAQRQGLPPAIPCPPPVLKLRPRGIFRLTVPVPPTINHAYATVQGRRVLSREGKEYKRVVGLMAAVASIEGGFTVPEGARLGLTLSLHFENNRRQDVSNRIKILEDALCEGLNFDDRAVDVLHVERKENDKANPRCEVRLEVL